MKSKIEVKHLGPRQQFIGTNGLRQNLVSKREAWEEIECRGYLTNNPHDPRCLCPDCQQRRDAQ